MFESYASFYCFHTGSCQSLGSSFSAACLFLVNLRGGAITEEGLGTISFYNKSC